jgi:FtsH-binding integral membrane protein
VTTNTQQSRATITNSQQTIYPTVQHVDQADREDTKDLIDAFLTRDSRNKFIARVYTILSGQLLVTASSIFAFGMFPDLGRWMRSTHVGQVIPILSLLLSTIAWFLVCSSVKARRDGSMKWKLLALFTLGESIAVGFISSVYTFRSVLTAMSATALATLSISLYTILNPNPKYDLSQWGAGLSSCGMIFLVYALIHVLEVTGVLPVGFLPYREGIFSLVGACLFSAYLAYHTKLIVAGKHTKYQMNEKDYVFGAMSLYNDIINVFIYLLRVLGEDRQQ